MWAAGTEASEVIDRDRVSGTFDCAEEWNMYTEQKATQHIVWEYVKNKTYATTHFSMLFHENTM